MTTTHSHSTKMRFEAAKQYAADAHKRNFPRDCECAYCVSARNLPGVLRIIAKWSPPN